MADLAVSRALKPDSLASRVAKEGAKKSRATSCQRCKKRKQKCDHRLPTCTNCLKANAECIQPEKYVQHTPKKDEYTLLLEKKVIQLEESLAHAQNSPQASPAPVSMISSPAGSSLNHLSHHPQSVSFSDPANPARGSKVNILNADPSLGSAPPASFSVVSSLLKDTYLFGRNNDSAESSPTTSQIYPNDSIPEDSGGLLPNYDFAPFFKYRPADIPDEKEGELLIDYYKKVVGKFAFLGTNVVEKLHNDRHRRPANTDDPEYRYNSFLLYSVYALSVVLNTSPDGTQPPFNAWRLYSTALCHARLCKSNNPLWQISALFLCANFQMRTDIDNGCHYDMVTRAMKLCHEAELHRAEKLAPLSLYTQEMRKRLFWFVYGLERLYAVSTGRPFSIEESEIEIPFPVDLEDEDLTDEKIIQARQLEAANGSDSPATQGPAAKSTPLTFVIYMWRVRRLESEMVTVIYRSDKPMDELLQKVDYYLAELRRWRDNHNKALTPREQNIAQVAYAKAVRLLLQPFLASLDPDGPLFQKCVCETGRLCMVFRDFYRRTESGFTTVAMHTNFIAGLTLIYCLWLSKDTHFLPILESIRVCTSSLFILAERSKLCREYRDTFENLVSATIKHVTEHVLKKAQSGQAGLSTPTNAPRPPMVTADSSTSIFDNIQQRVPIKQELQIKQDPGAKGPSFEPVPTLGQLAPSLQPTTSEAPPATTDPSQVPPQTQQSQYAFPPQMQMAPSNGMVYRNSLSQQAQQAQPSVAGNARGWIDVYGYDDTMYNMIQDISSWTKTIEDPTNFETQQIADHMWMNFTDFSLS